MKRKISFIELSYYLGIRLPMTIAGKIRKNLIYTHWSRGLNNFGDCLSPIILKHYGLTPVFSQQSKSEIILAGTILQQIPQTYTGYIVGTGGDNFPFQFPHAKVVAVRGPLTLKNMSVNNKNILLGDPGLLMPYVYPNTVIPTYQLGVIPHFVDENQEIIQNWKSKFKENVLFINPLNAPKQVIAEIKSCQCIVSSSLHGLIIADAFHIPTMRFVDRTTMPTAFYDYKFDDYYYSLGIESQYLDIDGSESVKQLIGSTSMKPKEKIISLQNHLNEAMLTISKQFKSNE